MCEAFSPEADVAAALLDWSGDLMNMIDAMRFLGRMNINKPNHLRFLAYLICLKTIKDDRPQWIPSIMAIGRNYEENCRRFCEDCYDSPTRAVPEPKASDINDSVHDNFEWFMAVCYNQKIPPECISDAEVRVKRLFSVMARDAINFNYRKLYSRIGYMCYLICLSFSAQAGLPNFFAEAMAYAMTRAVVSLAATTRQMEKLKLVEEHYDTFHRLVRRFVPKMEKEAEDAQVDLYELTVEWETGMFTTVHCPSNVLIIWDHIFFHLGEYHFFMRFLYTAHLKAMYVAGINWLSEEEIDNMQWNAVDLLNGTDDLMNADLAPVWSWWNLCPCFAFCQLLFRGRKADEARIKAKKLF